jgi:hypothetical protein
MSILSYDRMPTRLQAITILNEHYHSKLLYRFCASILKPVSRPRTGQYRPDENLKSAVRGFSRASKIYFTDFIEFPKFYGEFCDGDRPVFVRTRVRAGCGNPFNFGPSMAHPPLSNYHPPAQASTGRTYGAKNNRGGKSIKKRCQQGCGLFKRDCRCPRK